jgi:hypothetical protein
MTSRFILDKFDLDLSPPSLLVRFGLLLLLILLTTALDSIRVVDEPILGTRDRRALEAWCARVMLRRWLWRLLDVLGWLLRGRVGGGSVSGVDVHGALALAHSGCSDDSDGGRGNGRVG